MVIHRTVPSYSAPHHRSSTGGAAPTQDDTGLSQPVTTYVIVRILRIMTFDAQRARLSIDVPRETRRRVRLAVARRDQSIRQYVSDAIEARLQDDLVDETSDDGFALKASADPVLAELWDNPADAAYDDL